MILVGDFKNGWIVYLFVKFFFFYDVIFNFVFFCFFVMFEFVKIEVFWVGIWFIEFFIFIDEIVFRFDVLYVIWV